MTESIQKKLLRVRPPRVRITYDVETGGAIEKRELPFIVGILAALSGDVPSEKPLPPLRERKIKEIDRDNLNDILKTVGPRVDLAPVLKQDALKDLKSSQHAADKEIVFNSMDDFNPLRVVFALPTLNAKYRARSQIRGLQSKAESNDIIGAYLDKWVGADGAATASALQQELLKALNGAVPAEGDRPALRKSLADLQDKLLSRKTAAAQLEEAKGSGATKDQIQAANTAADTAGTEYDAANKDATEKRTAADTAKADATAAQDDTAKATAADEADKAAKTAEATRDAASIKKDATAAAALALDPAKAKTVADAAATAAVTELQKWALLPTDFALADTPASRDALAVAEEHGLLLANALGATDTPENRTRTDKLLAALKDKGTKSDTSTDEDLQRYKQRDDAKAILGGDANVTALVTQAGTPDPAAATGSTAWQRALLVLGMTEDDHPDDVNSSDYVDTREFQEAINRADCRSKVLAIASYLVAATNTNRAVVVDNLFPIVAALRSEDTGAATALALLRLHYFSSEILAHLQQKDADLLHVLKKGAAAVIDERVALIDQDLSRALSVIMHSDSFKTVEQTWRGVAHLVMNTETSTMLKLRILNVSKDELRKDMEKAVEFDQSALFKMVYEAEYDTLGGNPYSLLVGGYEIGGGADDITFLKKISEVAAAAHAPFVAAASSSLFGLSGFDVLDKPRDLAKIFEGAELEGWREFRETEDARYVSLVLPRVLLRLPYGRPEKRNTIQCEGLNFEEQTSGADLKPVISPNGDVISYPAPDTENFLWGNAAYVLAERITNAFALYSWTAAIRGVEGGGLVEGLPIYTYTSETGTTELLCPTEIAITDRREKELNDLGFISLCHNKGSGKAAFFGGQTTNQPKKYFSDSANANARISSMLPYILSASRFAHYIKVIMRDKIGSFLTRGNVESFLNTWIANYVLLDDNASQEIKASYPLRAASVVVTEVPGQPGVYRATAFIKPHFQLEELTTSIRLVAELPG